MSFDNFAGLSKRSPRLEGRRMRLTVTMFITLDGIAQAGGRQDEDREGGFEYGGWFIPHADGEFGQAIAARFGQADAFLLGRKTYEGWATYWPNVSDPDDPVAGPLNSLPKYVPTHTLEESLWDETTLLRDDAVAAIRELKEGPGRELQTHGSINLVQTLMREGLVDEYFIVTAPVVLGTGKRLFGDGTVPLGLELTSSKTTDTGVMLATYVPAGPPKLQDAPPPEQASRNQVRRGAVQ
jgi:dihydrofolate reductase